MKKLYVLAWLMMLSIMAMAQTVIVVDKDGNRVPYDPSKITSIEFQTTPPGFIINKDGKTINFTYDVAKSILGNPNHVFVDPETVNVDGEGEELAVQVKASIDFDVTTSGAWITFDSEAKDGQCYVKVAKNPSLDERTGTVTLISKDGTLTTTLNVVQAGKEDARYIDIDWEKSKLDSYDPETGVAQITFDEEVPIMGEFDVVLLPISASGYAIRLIDEVTKTEGKTATLATSEGDMGNLFKNTDFTLEFDIAGEGQAESARTRTSAANVFRPVKIEDFDGEKYVEIYNAEKASGRIRAADPRVEYRFSGSEMEVYKSETADISLPNHMLQLGLKGTCDMGFGKQQQGRVTVGNTKEVGFYVEGSTYSYINPLFRGTKGFEAETQEGTTTLKKDAIKQRKFTFKVNNIPVFVFLSLDVMADYSFNTQGNMAMDVGVTVTSKVKYGVKLNMNDLTNSTIINENTPQCELTLSPVINPDEESSFPYDKAETHVAVYPNIRMSVYGTKASAAIAPKPTVAFYAYRQPVSNNVFAKAVDCHVYALESLDMGLKNIPGVSVDLPFNGMYSYSQSIIDFPDEVKTVTSTPMGMIPDEEQQVTFHLTHKDFTGKEYNSEGALVMLEAEGGEFIAEDIEGSKKVHYTKADADGNVTDVFRLTSTEGGGSVKATVLYGNEVKPETVSEAKWEAKLDEYFIKCDNPEQEVESGTKSVEVEFSLNRWSGVNGQMMPWIDHEVSFKATGGTVAPLTAKTDMLGKVKVTFTFDEGSTEGEVIATAVEERNKAKWEGQAVGKITVKPEPVIDDFDKAKKLDDNSYVVRDNAGNEQSRGLLQSWSQWNRGKAGCDGQTRVIKVSLEDGKVDQETGSVETKGGGYLEIPIDQFGEPIQLLLDYLSNYGAIQGSFFTFKDASQGYSSSNYISVKFGCGDMHNLKSGTLQLQKKSSSTNARSLTPRRALEEDYSGELELVFVFTFTNYIYENDQEIDDGEYTVYGKAILNEFTPKISYYKLEPESGFVGVGKSVVVNTKEYTDEDAVWDWNDVELVASYVDYANYETDEGYFSWDPATHSLTSLKTNNNESVYVRFRLKSNPELTSYFTIRTGDGWPYTAFTISPAEQTVEHGYNCQFNVQSWAPANIAWDPYAIEIDPATNPGSYHKYFIYEPGFPRFRCSYAAEAGTYDVRMRLMSDHSVGFTMKITVTTEH